MKEIIPHSVELSPGSHHRSFKTYLLCDCVAWERHHKPYRLLSRHLHRHLLCYILQYDQISDVQYKQTDRCQALLKGGKKVKYSSVKRMPPFFCHVINSRVKVVAASSKGFK